MAVAVVAARVGSAGTEVVVLTLEFQEMGGLA